MARINENILWGVRNGPGLTTDSPEYLRGQADKRRKRELQRQRDYYWRLFKARETERIRASQRRNSARLLELKSKAAARRDQYTRDYNALGLNPSKEDIDALTQQYESDMAAITAEAMEYVNANNGFDKELLRLRDSKFRQKVMADFDEGADYASLYNAYKEERRRADPQGEDAQWREDASNAIDSIIRFTNGFTNAALGTFGLDRMFTGSGGKQGSKQGGAKQSSFSDSVVTAAGGQAGAAAANKAAGAQAGASAIAGKSGGAQPANANAQPANANAQPANANAQPANANAQPANANAQPANANAQPANANAQPASANAGGTAAAGNAGGDIWDLAIELMEQDGVDPSEVELARKMIRGEYKNRGDGGDENIRATLYKQKEGREDYFDIQALVNEYRKRAEQQAGSASNGTGASPTQEAAPAQEAAAAETEGASSGKSQLENMRAALACIRGQYGNQPDRAGNLQKDGFDYNAVQPIVNEYMAKYGSEAAAAAALEQDIAKMQEGAGQQEEQSTGEQEEQLEDKPARQNAPTSGWVLMNGKYVYLEGEQYQAWLREHARKEPSFAQSLGNAFGGYFANYMGGIDPSGVSTSNRAMAEISERAAADYQKAAQRNMQIANQNYRDEAEKNAAAQGAQENAQKVTNLGNASAGAAALARGVQTADYDAMMARSDEQATQGTQNQAAMHEARGTAEQARVEAKERDWLAKDWSRDNAMREWLSRGGLDEKENDEDEPDDDDGEPDDDGGQVVDTQPDDGGQVVDTQPDDGGQVVDTQPDDGGQVVDTQPDDGGQVVDTQPDDGGQVVDTQPDEQAEPPATGGKEEGGVPDGAVRVKGNGGKFRAFPIYEYQDPNDPGYIGVLYVPKEYADEFQSTGNPNKMNGHAYEIQDINAEKYYVPIAGNIERGAKNGAYIFAPDDKSDTRWTTRGKRGSQVDAVTQAAPRPNETQGNIKTALTEGYGGPKRNEDGYAINEEPIGLYARNVEKNMEKYGGVAATSLRGLPPEYRNLDTRRGIRAVAPSGVFTFYCAKSDIKSNKRPSERQWYVRDDTNERDPRYIPIKGYVTGSAPRSYVPPKGGEDTPLLEYLKRVYEKVEQQDTYRR